MVYGPIVPTSCRHAALPPFSLSLSLSLSPSLSLVLSLSASLLVFSSYRWLESSLVLSRSLSLVPSRSLRLSLSLSYSCRPFRVHVTLVVASCFVSRAPNSPLHGYPAASAKAGNSDRTSESVFRERESADSLEGDGDIAGRAKWTEMNDPTHTRVIDYTRIGGGFICKGVVNGGRE